MNSSGELAATPDGLAGTTLLARMTVGPRPSARGRLFRKYVVIFVALVGTVLAVSSVLELAFSAAESRAALGRLQRVNATLAATRIEQFVREVETPLRLVARPAGATDQRRPDYQRVLAQVPAIREISYWDADGREQLRVPRLQLEQVRSGIDHSGRPEFREAQARRTYYGPVTFRNESEPTMTLAVPERSVDGGVVVAEIDLKFIWEVVSAIAVGRSGRAYVVDARGQLIAHPDIARVLRRTDLSSLAHVQTARAEAPTQADEAVTARDMDGREVLAASQAIRPLGWYVLIEQPTDEALEPLYASLVRTGILLVAALALSVAASLYLARRMTRPIQALQASAARIGAGALDERIEIRTGDELEDLAREFNGMSAQLRESYAGLERKVQERTKELTVALGENVRLLEEVREKGRQLEAANRHKSGFLANMSHELRTPLNAIIGFSQVVREGIAGDLNEKQAEYLGDVLESAHHLLALINEVLDLSKVEAGRMELDLTTFSLREALEIGVTMTHERAARHGITVSLDIAPDVTELEADERKVRQVVLNLLSNAVKFTPDGGHVAVRAERADGEVRVAVQDTGIGIHDDERDSIFEEFRQSHRVPDKSREGTGLGLTLSKKFVELHGGRIWVESTVGKGSTFTFTLPLRER